MLDSPSKFDRDSEVKQASAKTIEPVQSKAPPINNADSQAKAKNWRDRLNNMKAKKEAEKMQAAKTTADPEQVNKELRDMFAPATNATKESTQKDPEQILKNLEDERA